ncbi:MAG: ParB N-terminal domain-containing protein [Myxococcaceae bacterium]|nr:ParB N-terminal domain-containing protein [Myxococcaceae bacterium]
MGSHGKATAASGKKPRAPRRKKVEAASKGLGVAEVMNGATPEAEALAKQIAADGGHTLGMYREPLGGHAVVLAALPIDKVEPTPYQRDRSETHVKKLANAMERVGRFLDPLIAVHKDSMYWTPNGNHRLGAMRLLGMKSIVALVVPEADVAYQILALNTEKAHNLKERSLEVIRMYRGLVGAGGGKESDFAPMFEEPHFATFGAAYEKRPRYSAGAYAPVVKRLESFLNEDIEKGLKIREERADKLLAFDDSVVAMVDSLKARGLVSPYLKNYVVARVNFLRFKKDGHFDFDETIDKLHAAVKKIDPTQVNKEDVAKMGGVPAESSDE